MLNKLIDVGVREVTICFDIDATPAWVTFWRISMQPTLTETDISMYHSNTIL